MSKPTERLSTSAIKSAQERSQRQHYATFAKSKYNKKLSFQYDTAKDWNDLPKSIRSITTFSSFKEASYSFLLKSDELSHRCTVNKYHISCYPFLSVRQYLNSVCDMIVFCPLLSFLCSLEIYLSAHVLIPVCF